MKKSDYICLFLSIIINIGIILALTVFSKDTTQEILDAEQIKLLERNMWLLSLAANASPLLGLLGTVTGMITAFNSIALNGTGDAGILAKGISEALYTTAGGLFVAIPCMIFYNYFNKRIDLVVADIEKTCTELLNYFRE